MTGSPVIIPMMTWHEGVPAMLESLRLYSPDNPVVVIGGEETRRHTDCIPVELCSSLWPDFEQRYVHHSSNPIEYDLSCFRRWFSIQDYITALGIKSFWNFDWDTLIFCNLADEEKKLAVDFTSPVNAFFCRDTGMYAQWISFLQDVYKDGIQLEEFVKRVGANDPLFPCISDMTLAWKFTRQNSLFALDRVQENPMRCFDRNISCDDGEWKMKDGIKDILWEKSHPCGIRNHKSVHFLSLHCWSGNKALMPVFLEIAKESR